jgi:Tfp pilus assembly protein FimT
MRRRIRGYTFAEAGVCIVIVLLLAAVVFPHVANEADSRAHRLFKLKMRSWVVAAKARAIETRTTVALSYDKNARSLNAIEEDSQGVSRPLPDLELPSDVDAVKFSADANESPSDGWRMPFFSDGSTTGGGIQFQNGEKLYSLVIDAPTGEATIADGKLPDLSFESWKAGGLQPRGT